MLGSPCYGAQMDATFVTSLLGLQSLCTTRRVGLTYPMLAHESLVTRARNRVVDWFMRSSCSHLFWIDSDIGFSPEDVLRVASYGHDFVVGAYPKKGLDLKAFQASGKSPASWYEYVVSFTSPLKQTPEGLLSVKLAGTGFMCWSRKVVETLVEANRLSHYKHGDADPNIQYEVFHTGVENGIYFSEDYDVCKQWTDMGNDIWLDPKIKLSHSGRFTWEGNIHEQIYGS